VAVVALGLPLLPAAVPAEQMQITEPEPVGLPNKVSKVARPLVIWVAVEAVEQAERVQLGATVKVMEVKD
jgi:hypothetical protein